MLNHNLNNEKSLQRVRVINRRKMGKKGFTLVELLVVLVIMGVLAAIAVPAIMHFIDSGKQTSRMNTARTIFLAAQDRLTEMRLSKNLKAEFTSEYYTKDAKGEYTEKAESVLKGMDTNVYTKIGDDNFPTGTELLGNKPYVHYISKKKGNVDPANAVVKLLDPIILDKAILNEAIVVEYNIKTGLVLSVFYSDSIADGAELTYEQAPTDDIKRSIYGKRPYLTPSDRKQGYYGVGYTGTLEESLPVNINIWDSSMYAMPEEAAADRTKPKKWKNVLYAQIIVSESELKKSDKFTLSIMNGDTEYSIQDVDLNDTSLTSNGMSDDAFISKGKRLYRYDGTNGNAVESGYARFIWILDYVGGVTANTSKNYSIGVLKDTAKNPVTLEPKFGLKAKISGGVNATSFTEAHPYYATAARSSYADGRYSVSTPRHLYNIRYTLGGNFTQKSDIKMNEEFNKVTNFEPIAGKDTTIPAAKNEFTGIYTGTGFSISDLAMETDGSNAGLFAVVAARSNIKEASVKGLTLENPAIKGAANAGAVCGTLRGFVSNILVRYPLESTNTIEGVTTGGIVGLCSGTVADSTFVSPADTAHMSGTEVGGFVGKLQTGNKLQRNYFLAVAPQVNNKINPFSGSSYTNEDNANKLYYLSGRGVRPDVSEYNITASANDAEAVGTAQLSTIIPDKWGSHKVSEEEAVKEDNKVYPYAYGILSEPKIASAEKPSENPDWPIVDNEKAAVKLKYYEVYDNAPNVPVFDKLEPLTSEKLVVNEGYAIEFGYTQNLEITFGKGDLEKTYKLEETANNQENPVWEWSDENPTGEFEIVNMPMKFTIINKGKEETVYRIFLKNSMAEKLANGGELTEVKVKINAKQVYTAAFNPLYGNSVGKKAKDPFIVRSPRHLDNVDMALDKNFNQQLNLDFNIYRGELLDIGADDTEISVDNGKSLSFETDSVVTAGDSNTGYYGTYNGLNHYVKNVKAQSGLFYSIGSWGGVSGTVKSLALIRSEFTAPSGYHGASVGSVAAENSGSISRLEVSDVIIRGGSNGNVGGFVGVNSGNISDSYFNSAYRGATGVYSTPILGSGGNMGGLVGLNSGNMSSCYTTAIGPNKSPVVGANSGVVNKDSVFYLSATGYNGDNPQGVGVPKTTSELKTALTSGEWEEATESTTKELDQCTGAYPYPKISGIHHYYDWPILQITFKYYERYKDLSYGYYFFVNNDKAVDTLKYDPDATVIEEGYLIDFVSEEFYDIRIGTSTVDISKDNTWGKYSVMDGKRVFKFFHGKAENAVSAGNASGITPIKVQASLIEADKPDKEYDNELFGKTTEGNVYFNPLFAKAITLTSSSDDTMSPSKAFEIRSPRHILNISKKNEYGGYNYRQTAGVSFENNSNSGNNTEEKTETRQEILSGSNYLGTTGLDFTAIPNMCNSIFGNGVIVKNVQDGTNSEYRKLISKETKTEPVYEYFDGGYTETTTTESFTVDIMGFSYSPGVYLWVPRGANVEKKITKITTIKTVITQENKNIVYSRDQDYKSEEITSRTPLDNLGKNMITVPFTGTYDGALGGYLEGTKDNRTGRVKSTRIYSMILNVLNNTANPKSNTGSAFGDLSAEATVQNLEFVDSQIRYVSNGFGGGIVATVSRGLIDNVNVYNESTTASLFANAAGKTSSAFCNAGGKFTNITDHVHGGIAGIVEKTGIVSNCTVGTASSDIEEITSNKTQIVCKINNASRYSYTEETMIPIGGIVGEAWDGGHIIACTNIASVIPMTDVNLAYSDETPHSIGGIVGRLGGKRFLPNESGDRNRPGHAIGCYNTGSVIITKGYNGGIAGRTNSQSTITSCYNAGRLNIESVDGTIKKTVTKGSVRIGGIVGEPNSGTTVETCYNIGYISDNLGSGSYNGAGTILGHPFNANGSAGVPVQDMSMHNVYSLKADLYTPRGIIGAMSGTVTVNGINDISKFATWESRASLRNNKALVTTGEYNSYPFTLDLNSSYIYPQLLSFTVDGKTYSNKHITPWEYIDAYYDTTLKYYEKYDGAAEVGENYINRIGDTVSTLKNDKIVIEDGYILEIGKEGSYKVVINGIAFPSVSTKSNVSGFETRNIITLTNAMKTILKPGYNKIQLFTMLPTNTSNENTNKSNREDNAINRIIGSTSTAAIEGSSPVPATEGVDLYFDYYFPKEIKYGTTKTEGAVVKGVPPVPQTKFSIRSPRHLDSIGLLTETTGATGTADKTLGKTFTQELDLDFLTYDFGSYVRPAMGYKGNCMSSFFNGSVVMGDFKGIYSGGYKTITNLPVHGTSISIKSNVGLFEENSGTIQNLKISNGTYAYGANASMSMGVIAGENSGTINRIAIDSTLVSSIKTSKLQKMGGVVGVNNTGGKINNLYFVNTAPKTASDPSAIELGSTNPDSPVGGIAGENAGTIDFVLYLAQAPFKDGSQLKTPISGKNTRRITDNVMFLSGKSGGKDYNNFDPGTTGGIGRSTAKLSAITSWPGWGKSAGYPYPNLSNITAPTSYPTADDLMYKLAYYEKYDDGGYGWFYGEGDSGNTIRADGDYNIIDNTVSESGYVVIVPTAGTYSVRYDGDNVQSVTAETLDGKSVVKLSSSHTAGSSEVMTKPIKVSVNTVDMSGDFNWYNPLFGRSLYKTQAEATGFAVRTPKQMQNISLTDTDKLTFTQELDLDFTGTAIDKKVGAVVTGEFKGKYIGGGKRITGLTINAAYENKGYQGLSNVGLFSTNRGTIESIILSGSHEKPVSIIGNSNVGGIVGHNLSWMIVDGADIDRVTYPPGTVSDCIAEGDENGKGLHIEAKRATKAADDLSFDDSATGLNAGGIAGLNDGATPTGITDDEVGGAKILNCEVNNTTSTITAYNFGAGITAVNGERGIIKNPKMNKVTITCSDLSPVGKKFGSVFAVNNNTVTEDVVYNDAEIVDVNFPASSARLALMDAVAKAKELEITEGTEPGNYVSGTAAAYDESIVNAEAVLKARTAEAEQFKDALSDLNTATFELKNKLLYGIELNKAELEAEVTVENQAEGLDGSVSVKGNKVTVKVPGFEDGQKAKVTVDGEKVSETEPNVFTFTMPERDVVINIEARASEATPSPTPGVSAEPTQTPEPSAEPGVTPTPTEPDSTQTPEPTGTPEPTENPSETPTPTETPKPTEAPESTESPSSTESPEEKPSPTTEPTEPPESIGDSEDWYTPFNGEEGVQRASE